MSTNRERKGEREPIEGETECNGMEEKDKWKGNEEVRETDGEMEGFGISMLCQQLGKEGWMGNKTKVLNGEKRVYTGRIYWGDP